MRDVRWLAMGVLCLGVPCMSGCAVKDAMVAHDAQSRLMGLSEVDLESCLGAPDQHSSFGSTDVLTYYANSTSNTSLAAPVIGGVGMSYGGYCHATFQVRDGRVTQILYSGEKNAFLAPDAYCAPIMDTCLHHLRRVAQTEPRGEPHSEPRAEPARPASPEPAASPQQGTAPITPSPAAGGPVGSP